MKWLLSLLIALCLVTPAVAGEVPYIAVVGNDIKANGFYNSAKYKQFMYNQDLSWELPVCIGTYPKDFGGCEKFLSSSAICEREVCDATSTPGNLNALVGNGNAGSFEWYVRLPEEPVGEINLCIQCGVLKPNAFAAYKYNSVNLCAAETGEKIGPGICSPQTLWAGENPLITSQLPTITAIAYPGPNNISLPATGFNLTAFKNPSDYGLSFDSSCNGFPMKNNGASQVLDGSAQARIMLKSCMDKCIVVKLPVWGQINALGQTEYDLKAGDLIYVKMKVPNPSGVDIYCNSQSLKVMGIGEH